MNTHFARREFLKKATTLMGTLAIAPFILNSITGTISSKSTSKYQTKTPHINPAFRIQILKDGSMEIFTYQKPDSKISYYFHGIEEDILLLISEDKSLEANFSQLGIQYSLSETECKGKVELAMSEFEKKGLIYYGELMLVKKTSSDHE